MKIDSATAARLLPLNQPFTRMEAFVDYGVAGLRDIPVLAVRWQWSEELTSCFLLEFKLALAAAEEETPVSKKLAQEVVDLFNQVMDRKGRRRVGLNDARIRLITGRIREGKKYGTEVGLKQFGAVFAYKKKEWTGTEQEKHLVLETLLRPSHFQKYLEAARDDYKKKMKSEKASQEGIVLDTKLFR